MINGKHVYDRFIILSCDNVIPEEQRDSKLLEKLATESEYLICASIKCLRISIKNGYKFTESERTIKNREDYAIKNNSLALFLTECCDCGKGSTPTSIFKTKYKYWCKENKLPCEKPNSISKLLTEKFGVEKYKSNTDCYRLTIKNV